MDEYVITGICAATKDRGCVGACPVDCIYEGEKQLYINPNECIFCGACVPECPVAAIFALDDVPAAWKASIAENAVFFTSGAPGSQTPARPKV